MRTRLFSLLVIFISVWGCQKLPLASEGQFDVDPSLEWRQDSLFITLPNPVKCPLRVSLSHDHQTVDSLLTSLRPLILSPLETKVLAVPLSDWSEELQKGLHIASVLGALEYYHPDSGAIYGLPFQVHKTYQVIQAYHGTFSHHGRYSEYAIDFNLQPGDTICASRDGIVVGVIEGYDIGGKDRKYRPYANFLSLYHPDGVITQYVHLLKEGALVELGDTVRRGEPIGLSGNTGFTSSPHLHFNVLKPTRTSAESMPVNFSIGPGATLRKGQRVRH